MAVTSLWRIKWTVNKVINYAENPVKTTVFGENSDTDLDTKSPENVLNIVMNYAQRDSATEIKKLVSGINCNPENADKEMMQVKKFFAKTDGTVAYHGYQSFSENEVDAETAHQIGCELARKLWGERYQVVVATHIDKQSHIHNHFVINTVSFVDGKKFHRTNSDYKEMQKVSDELCEKYGLNVIYHPKSSKKSYVEYKAEKSGNFTKSEIIRRDIDECLMTATTQRQFYEDMKLLGYTFDFSHKYTTISHPSFEKPRRLKTLGADYVPTAIKERVASNWRRRVLVYPDQDKPEILFFDGDKNNNLVFQNYQSVYVHFVYGLNIVKDREYYNRELQRWLADDLIKFDKRVEEQNFLLDNNLFTEDDICDFKENLLKEFSELTDTRRIYRNELKKSIRAEDEPKQLKLKSDISNTTGRLSIIRKQLKICNRIMDNEPRIEGRLKNIRDLCDRDLQPNPQVAKTIKTKTRGAR